MASATAEVEMAMAALGLVVLAMEAVWAAAAGAVAARQGLLADASVVATSGRDAAAQKEI